MKKLKLIFGLLLVAAFVAITVISYTGSEKQQAILKSQIIVPRKG